ncbi:MAG TPA: cytochrome b/b6 domain-containing protein [Homoserinimonas sp.]|nr:cytochrome b/b6 domain-containing protein [Homoserinimonas sp.]
MTSPSLKDKRWFPLVWMIPAALVALAVAVLFAQWLRGLPEMQSFLADYPGESELPEGAPVGFPAWLGWQHFLNGLLILLIIRSGWQVRATQRPSAYWTRNNKGLIRTKGSPKKISLDLWFHQSLDVLWVLNGLIFYILLFATGQWMRLIPVSWDVFPNAFSAALQYASLNWPTENGWANYNSLQLLTYFLTVFVAAPLAIITGIRMSGAWPAKAPRLNKAYPIEVARAIHFPVMLYFVAFIVVHVTLVLATGALRNLNHMYAMSDDAGSWAGFWIFAASIVAMTLAWFAARPLFLRPVAALSGSVTR